MNMTAQNQQNQARNEKKLKVILSELLIEDPETDDDLLNLMMELTLNEISEITSKIVN